MTNFIVYFLSAVWVLEIKVNIYTVYSCPNEHKLGYATYVYSTPNYHGTRNIIWDEHLVHQDSEENSRLVMLTTT